MDIVDSFTGTRHWPEYYLPSEIGRLREILCCLGY